MKESRRENEKYGLLRGAGSVCVTGPGSVARLVV